MGTVFTNQNCRDLGVRGLFVRGPPRENEELTPGLRAVPREPCALSLRLPWPQSRRSLPGTRPHAPRNVPVRLIGFPHALLEAVIRVAERHSFCENQSLPFERA